MASRVSAFVLVFVLVFVLSLLVAAATSVQVAAVPGGLGELRQQEPPNGDDDATTSVTPLPGGDIIPEPETGQTPDDPGDRGGGLQIALFVAIVAGVGAIVAIVVRESRRSRGRSPG